jgi:hypothetical protein
MDEPQDSSSQANAGERISASRSNRVAAPLARRSSFATAAAAKDRR